MTWKNNAIMTLNNVKVSDHGRSSLSESVERIGVDKRMADGTLRRQFVGLKRTWSVSWENLPSTNLSTTGMKTVDGGMSGEVLEAFYNSNPGVVRMILRRGNAINLTPPAVTAAQLPFDNGKFYIADVMLTEFSKEVIKRSATSDIWNASLTMEEV